MRLLDTVIDIPKNGAWGLYRVIKQELLDSEHKNLQIL